MIEAGSVGSGGVVFGTDIKTSSMPWVFSTSLDLALDPGSFRNLDPNESGFIHIVVGVCKRCRTSISRRSKNCARSGTLSKGMGLLRRN